MSVILQHFGWPGGDVWGNLIASLVSVGAAWWRIRARQITQHAEQLAQAARHHREALEQAAAHHEDLRQHVAAHCTDVKEHVNAVVSAAAGTQEAAERVAPERRRRTPGGGM